jgi:hypothetical protein
MLECIYLVIYFWQSFLFLHSDDRYERIPNLLGLQGPIFPRLDTIQILSVAIEDYVIALGVLRWANKKECEYAMGEAHTTN